MVGTYRLDLGQSRDSASGSGEEEHAGSSQSGRLRLGTELAGCLVVGRQSQDPRTTLLWLAD